MSTTAATTKEERDALLRKASEPDLEALVATSTAASPAPEEPSLTSKIARPKTTLDRIAEALSGSGKKVDALFDYCFSSARIINALGNGAISADAGKPDPGLIGLGLTTGSLNSYASGEAQTLETPKAPLRHRFADRFISIVYGLACGLTIAGSVFLMLSTWGGLSGIIFVGAFMGCLVTALFIRKCYLSSLNPDKNKKHRHLKATVLGFIKALALGLSLSAVFIGMGCGIAFGLGFGYLPLMLTISILSMSLIMGACSMVFNYGINKNGLFPFFKSIDRLLIKTGRFLTFNTEKRVEEKAESELKTTESIPKKSLKSFTHVLAMAACIASAAATGGLTYVSIMNFLPILCVAMGVSFSMPAILGVAIGISAIASVGLVFLLYKGFEPLINRLLSMNVEQVKAIFKELYFFDKTKYEDNPSNKRKFVFRAVIITLAMPLVLIGVVMTMLLASQDFIQVITQLLTQVSKVSRSVDVEIASDLGLSVLSVGLLSDAAFGLYTMYQLLKKVFSYEVFQLTQIPKLENPKVTTAHNQKDMEGNLPPVVPPTNEISDPLANMPPPILPFTEPNPSTSSNPEVEEEEEEQSSDGPNPAFGWKASFFGAANQGYQRVSTTEDSPTVVTPLSTITGQAPRLA